MKNNFTSYLPENSHTISFSEDSNQYNDKYSIRSLSEAYGNINSYVIKSKGRIKLLELYHGTANENKFIDEIIHLNLDDLLDHKAFVKFLLDVTLKMLVPNQEWIQVLMQNFHKIIKQEAGPILYFHTFDAYPEYFQQTIAKFCFENMLVRPDQYFQQLTTDCIRRFSNNFEIVQPFFKINWISNRSSLFYLIDFIEASRIDLTSILTPFAEQALTIAAEQDCAVILCQIIYHGSDNLKDIIFENIRERFGEMCLREPQWAVAHAMICEATVPQRQIFLSQIEEICRRPNIRTPFFFGEIINAILISSLQKDRNAFLNRNSDVIERFMTQSIRDQTFYLKELQKESESPMVPTGIDLSSFV